MIRIRLQGRMGNQMFQYAFALYASIKLKTGFVIEIRKRDEFQLGYFRLSFPFSLFSYGKLIKKLYNCFQRRTKMDKTFFVPNGEEDWSNRTLTDHTEYKGYFQDAKFSRAIKPLLLKHFSIKKRFIRKFEKDFVHLLGHKLAVLHIRLNDYQDQHLFVSNKKFDWLLPQNWYEKALQEIDLTGYKLVVISDNIEMARTIFSKTDRKIIFPDGDAITHFQFLLHADVCIISNSSFAWWGAFLNSKPGKKVIAPSNWVGYNAGFEFPIGIMTREFEWIQ